MMSGSTIDRLIINSPDEEPSRHWRIAVKIVEDRGIERLKVMEVEG